MRKHRITILIVFGLVLAFSLELSARSPLPQSNAEATVYVTRTGRKYHTASCRYLRKGATAMKLRDAVKAGYAPCSVCKPPSLKQ
jgi:micrococcal nuclease